MIKAIILTTLISLPVVMTLQFLGESNKGMKKGIKCLVDSRQCARP